MRKRDVLTGVSRSLLLVGLFCFTYVPSYKFDPMMYTLYTLMYVCTYVYIYIHIYTYIHIYIQAYAQYIWGTASDVFLHNVCVCTSLRVPPSPPPPELYTQIFV
jgi:hypothetical protein